MLREKIALCALLVLGAIPASAWAENLPPCPVPDDVRVRSFPKEIPRPLLAALSEKYGAFAGPGEPFNSGDVILSGSPPQRRIVFAWERGTRWVFATEHGGIGYNNPVLVYELTPESGKARFLKEEFRFGETLCETARERIAAQD